MRITFLGHQGWQFEHRGRSLLLDPILEAIGNGADKLPVWPQRRLDFSKMAPIEAVIVSHEHADHFSLETLAAIPRCRVYVSDLASWAMCAAIQELGFTVERYTPLNGFLIMDGLKVTPLPGLYNKLEPDVYGLLFEDDTNASFLTGIDTIPHPDIFAWLAQNCPQRTLDNLTNNFLEPRQPLVMDANAHTQSRGIVAASLMEFVQKLQPKRAVISGQGWCFQGAKQKFNHSFFSVDNAWLTQAARELAPHVEWIHGQPGMRLELKGPNISVAKSDVMTLLPSADRSFNPASVQEAEPFAPWTGLRDLPPERLSRVQAFIREEYGQLLSAHSPKLSEALYYLKFQDTGELAPTLAIVLRNGNAGSVFELDYGHLVFKEVPPNKPQVAVLGLEIWASDFECMLDAKEESFTIYESAVRTWSHLPGFIESAAVSEALTWFTPRFRPKETLAFYRRQVAALRAVQANN
jgi:hypothetical protein